MAKDVARLREEEAKKERERIAKLKTEEPKKEAPVSLSAPAPKPEAVLQTREPEKPKPSLMPHAEKQKPIFLKTRTRSEKIIIRAIVIGILLFILLNGVTFGYWYFSKRRTAEIVPTPQPAPTVEVEEPTAQPALTPAPTPIVFFEALGEKTITLETQDGLIALLSNALKEEYPQGFTRVLVKNEGNASLTLQEFLGKAGVTMPEPLLSLLKDDFMLFVYASPARKRLGLIAELSQTEGVQDIMRNWEPAMEQDTKPLWDIVGQKGSAYTSVFRQTIYQNSPVRFQTFSVIDFGVVYTLFGNKLVLATSFEGLARAVDQMIQSR